MDQTYIVSQVVSLEELLKRIIGELNIGHLPVEQQQGVIASLSEMLAEKAAFAVMEKIPEEVMVQLDALSAAGKNEEIPAIILQHVPDAQDVAMEAAQEGLSQYKEQLIQTGAKRTAAVV